MFSRCRALNVLIVTGMLFLISGTRILCDIGSSLSTDHCCSEAEEHSHDKASTQDIADNQGSAHHEDSAPEKAPADPTPDHCCSNWYVFTAESANSSLTVSLVPQILPPITGLPVHSQPLTKPVYETIERDLASANNRAPDCPLYLTLHSYRV